MSKLNKRKRKLFKTKIAQHPSYPFQQGSPGASLPLVEQLLLSPEIKTDKERIQEATIIDATSVSNYYFMGTDQEYWDERSDFPNIAPPFESFILTFQAPPQSISKVHGTREWGENLPNAWALLCQGVDNHQAIQALQTDEGKQRYIKTANQMIEVYTKMFRDIYDRKVLAGDTRHPSEQMKDFTESEQSVLTQLKAAHTTQQIIQEGKWDEIIAMMQSVSTCRWALNMALCLNISDGNAIRCIGPVMSALYLVQDNGMLFIRPDGRKSIEYATHGETSKQTIQDMQTRFNRTEIEAITTYGTELTPFFHAGLLAISFLHCKNVVLAKEATIAAQRNIQNTLPKHPEITYHVLEIAPMREVLRAEGRSEQVGTKNALHICRGHFRHYEEGRGLFGKYHGTFWVPQHARGTSDEGTRVKDYRINTAAHVGW